MLPFALPPLVCAPRHGYCTLWKCGSTHTAGTGLPSWQDFLLRTEALRFGTAVVIRTALCGKCGSTQQELRFLLGRKSCPEVRHFSVMPFTVRRLMPRSALRSRHSVVNKQECAGLYLQSRAAPCALWLDPCAAKHRDGCGSRHRGEVKRWEHSCAPCGERGGHCSVAGVRREHHQDGRERVRSCTDRLSPSWPRCSPPSANRPSTSTVSNQQSPLRKMLIFWKLDCDTGILI